MAVAAPNALLVVDVQNDFTPGGALPVPEGDAIIPQVNAYIAQFQAANLLVVASRDWHPPETRHFQAQGGPWPPHCVQNTPGAAFHPELRLPEEVIVVSKGMDPDEDAYSAFQARDDDGRPLADILHERDVARLYVVGLALDYCVKASALDARRAGLATTLLLDGTRAVNVSPHDGQLAIEELLRAGVSLETSETLAAAVRE